MTSIAWLQVGEAVPTRALDMIFGGTWETKFVLIILGVLSLLSWAIMLAKWLEFRRIQRSADSFLHAFERAHRLDDVGTAAGRVRASPFTRVFDRAVQFLSDTTPALAATADRQARLSGSQVEALRLVLDAQSGFERDGLSQYVPTLGTIGSVSPLIGLFGTVLGIISSFTGMATSGTGNISAVAPGIATALVATAAALAVAIPAVFGYNVFATRLNRLDGELDGFGSELIALMVREGRI